MTSIFSTSIDERTWSSAHSTRSSATRMLSNTGIFQLLRRSELKTTLTEEHAIAADAIIGFIVRPQGIIKRPIAIGSIIRLYTTARTKFTLMLRNVRCEMSRAARIPAVPSLRPYSCNAMPSSSSSGCTEESSTTSAASMAISVPVAIVMPKSAWMSAGASLMPSPTNATLRPCFCIWSTTRSLSSGWACAKTFISGMPTAWATARAVCTLSPVTMATAKPRSISAETVPEASDLTVSASSTMLTIVLYGMNYAPDQFLVHVTDKVVVRHAHLACRDGACLVEYDTVDAARFFQYVSTLDQNSVRGPNAGTNHHRRRRGQSERTRTGHNDDRYCDLQDSGENNVPGVAVDEIRRHFVGRQAEYVDAPENKGEQR
ncbi:hypothetical protein OGATHE_001257 [Ogataea polymorpha]|uniref:Uncharacterized protein n=1 Tax=Ogataea polymorpha TaxID=460523 RepID=A0A9P8PSG0_9ASCO|nr:hypothetical protein OGATHE_001257 [Ogataea polymorpha]